MNLKDNYIRVRVTTEEKEKIKNAAKAKGMNMSEFMIRSTQSVIEKQEEKDTYKKIIEARAERTDKKLAKITERIRGKKSKKISFFNLGHSENQSCK